MSPLDGERRPPVEQSQINQARMVAARYARAQRRMTAASCQAAAALDEMRALHAAAEKRFGEVPFDADLLDVLAMIEILPDGTWHWTGIRNNKGLATIRHAGPKGSERSVVRYLSIAFGLIGPDDHGTLYPTGSPADVNPWKRKLRRSELPQGKADRFKAAS